LQPRNQIKDGFNAQGLGQEKGNESLEIACGGGALREGRRQSTDNLGRGQGRSKGYGGQGLELREGERSSFCCRGENRVAKSLRFDQGEGGG